MDKNRKLRRYDRKDYTQVVEFPVEIVGRDGVVRRYTFEESIRLYQRRIASAEARYVDLELARAEAEHCRRRIEQLRRSYLERYGDGGLRSVRVVAGGPALAGEVTAFLRRCLGSTQALDQVEIEHAGTLEHCEAYGASVDGAGTLVLYLYSFEQPGDCERREAFFAQVKLLQLQRPGVEGVEQLVAFHHSADYGMVLSGSGATAHQASGRTVEQGAESELDAPPAAHANALERLSRGDYEGALRAFERSYEHEHYRRTAYLGAAFVADQLGAFGRAGLAAEMGSRYFPDDPSMAWHLAVARLRQGQLAGAYLALARAQAVEADPHAVLLLRAILALLDGHNRTGARLLERARHLDAGPDRPLVRTRQRLHLALAGLGLMRALGFVVGTACLGLALLGNSLAWMGAAAGLGLMLASGPVLRMWLRVRHRATGAVGPLPGECCHTCGVRRADRTRAVASVQRCLGRNYPCVPGRDVLMRPNSTAEMRKGGPPARSTATRAPSSSCW